METPECHSWTLGILGLKTNNNNENVAQILQETYPPNILILEKRDHFHSYDRFLSIKAPVARVCVHSCF